MEATGLKNANKDYETEFTGATVTIKTTPIKDVPCATCNNLVTTVPIFAKKGLCSECWWCLCCCFPIWCFKWCCTYNCTTSVNRVEHYCPNCGAFLLVATPSVPKCKGCGGCGWNRLFPIALANN